MMKPRVAVFKLSSCAGCQLQILNMEAELLRVAELVDIAYFPMAGRDADRGPYDIGFVEGAVTSGEEIRRLKRARSRCGLLVAFGSCASFGGVPSMKNWLPERVVEELVYEDVSAINSTKAYGIDQYVAVDACLKGCPVSREETAEVIKAAVTGQKPRMPDQSVCFECRARDNECLLQSRRQPCLGPVTLGGCGALCPSHRRACEGCRGPGVDANPASLVASFRQYGIADPDITRRFRKFAGMTPEFSREVPAA